jgi:hypothetical protein
MLQTEGVSVADKSAQFFELQTAPR